MSVVRVLAVAVLASAACNAGTFVCESDEECGAEGALCQPPNGYCSFPDLECASGQRYGEHSGDVAGKCVAATDEAESSSGPPSSPTSDASAGASGSEGPSATSDDPGVVTDGGDAATTSTGSSPDATSTDDGGPMTGTSTTAMTTDPTNGTTGDPYGSCAAECTYPGATCLTGNGHAMCAPSCTTPASPSSECPEPVEPGYDVQCMAIGDLTTWCFVDCNQQSCPTGMVCAPGSVCSWET